MRIVIPKAASEQARWQSQLAESGADIVFSDPWQIDILPETAEMRSQWLDLDLNFAVFCVSPTAAKVLVGALDQYWPMPPVRVRWLCNGPRTAAVLRNAGLKAEFPETGHTSEDVFALIRSAINPADRCLIIRGEDGRDWLADTLQQQGMTVVTVDCYRRSMNTEALGKMAEQAEDAQALWLSSEYLGEQLIDNNAQFWRNWKGQWWLSSNRLVDWAKQNNLNNVKQANGATPQALEQLLSAVSK